MDPENNTSSELSELSERLHFAEEQTGENCSSLATLKKETQDLKSEISLLKSLLIHQDDEIKLLKDAVIDLTSRSMRNNVLFHGIKEHEHVGIGSATEDCTRVVHDALVKHGYNDIPPIERAHRLGAFNRDASKAKPRPIVARFTSQKVVEELLAFSKSLPRTKDGFKMTPQYPLELQERRRSHGEKIAEIKRSAGAENVRARIVKDKLYINGELQKEPLPRPRARDLLTPTIAERETIVDEPPELLEGPPVLHKGSTISASTCTANSIAEVRKAYQKALFARPAAAHTIAVFRLSSGSPANIKEGWQDDGAHGAGRHIRFLLSRKKKENIAVFLTIASPIPYLGMQGYRALEEALEKLI